jgi:hypothetical protein
MMRGKRLDMAEKYQIYASGEQSNRVTVWHNHIYASHLKNRTWIITFVSDGEDGRFSMSARNIRQPTEFVDALYAEDVLDIDYNSVARMIGNLFQINPDFAVACAAYNDIRYKGELAVKFN